LRASRRLRGPSLASLSPTAAAMAATTLRILLVRTVGALAPEIFNEDPVAHLVLDPDVAEDGAGELGKKPSTRFEPGAVLRREGEFEAAGRLIGEPGSGLLWRCGRNDCREST
jgi:hypothetical protein